MFAIQRHGGDKHFTFVLFSRNVLILRVLFFTHLIKIAQRTQQGMQYIDSLLDHSNVCSAGDVMILLT